MDILIQWEEFKILHEKSISSVRVFLRFYFFKFIKWTTCTNHSHFTMSARNVDLERDAHYCFSITNSS